jgi:AAA family ATP:ADP antiporter
MARDPSFLERLFKARRDELPALLWSFAYFFFLLGSYFMMRPVRESIGVANGIQNLPWLYTAVFLAMIAMAPIFGWVVKTFPRRVFLPAIYWFSLSNILLFWALFQAGVAGAWVARAFYIWLSVFNLFAVSVFWSFMADIFTPGQARRLFGVIAAGGSTGAIVGPAVTAFVAPRFGSHSVLPISALMIFGAVLAIHRLRPLAGSGRGSEPGRPIGGSVLAGARLALISPYLLGICLLLLIYTLLADLVYFHQAYVVEASFSDPDRRTAVFAGLDLAVNVLTFGGQFFAVSRLVGKLGIGWTLALVPFGLALGLGGLALAPIFATLAVVQILRRSGEYAIMKPARDMLYSVVDRETKYKAKNFIDTAVYRGGDFAGSWAHAGLTAAGLSLSAIALLGIPLALAWGWLGLRLGRRYVALEAATGPKDVA